MTRPQPSSLSPTSPAPADWTAARGAKWKAGLAGMEAMLAPVDAPLIRALHLDGPCRIADLGCGGGATALEILRRAPAGSVVHGFDLSPALVESARARIPVDLAAIELTGTAGADAIADARHASIAFETADLATALPPAGPYHRLVSRFGVMFFPDAPAAFANLARWLAPGGRFAFAVWGRPSDNPWMQVVRDAVANVAEVPSPPADAPGPFRYADANALLGLLREAGFDELRSHEWRGPLPVGGELPAAEAADFALASFASFGELLDDAGDEAWRRAKRSLTASFSKHERDGAVWMDAGVHLVTGTRRGDAHGAARGECTTRSASNRESAPR